MANRRMFSKNITETDIFLDMPMSTQCLYFHLNMSADDDGFIGNAKTIKRMVGASDDDFKLLMAKEFIIPFESGVVVIKDWKIHNYIRSDRYNSTVYTKEKKQLKQNENGQYELGMTSGIPTVDTGKDRLGKDRLGKDRKDTMSGKPDGVPIPYQEIIAYLNQKADRKYKHTTPKTKQLIKARWNEGFQLEDFKAAIDNQVREWLNDSKMDKYLRPETLFGTKFESYLNNGPNNGGGSGGSEYDNLF